MAVAGGKRKGRAVVEQEGKRGRRASVVDKEEGEESQVSLVASMLDQADTQASAAAAIAVDGCSPLAAEVIRPPSIKTHQNNLISNDRLENK